MIDARGFDASWYLDLNSDVRAARIDPYGHYLEYGWREGRNPNALFDTRYYLANNSDVAAAGLEPLAHFNAWGWREGRDPSVRLDISRYLDANPDVRDAGVNPLIHYFIDGAREGRPLIPVAPPAAPLPQVYGFDRAYYLAVNDDVRAAGVDPLRHYQVDGAREGRSPNSLFNAAYYLAVNDDVRAAKVDPYQHYLTDGWRENRNPSTDFDISDYKTRFSFVTADPLRDFLDERRYRGLPSSARSEPLPAIVYSDDSYTLFYTFAGGTRLDSSSAGVGVTSFSSPLHGRLLANFDRFDLRDSFGPIAFAGSGRLPSQLDFGRGDNTLSGTYDLGGRQVFVNGHGGNLTIDIHIDGPGQFVVHGGEGATVLTTSGTARIQFDGSAGSYDDVVRTSTGDDSLSGGGGRNVIDGGGGIDFVDYNHAASGGVDVDLVNGIAFDRSGAGRFHDTLIAIENVSGTSIADRMAGGAGRDTFYAHAGNDVLVGRGGEDSLQAGDGSDVLIGGRGADDLFGEAGNDLLIDDAIDVWVIEGDNVRIDTSQQRGGDGDDLLVLRLGATPETSGRPFYMYGENGADTFIFDTSLGTWAEAAVFFRQHEGDRLDFSAFRDTDGTALTFADVVAASSSPFDTSILIDLDRFENAAGAALAGQIVVNGIFEVADLRPENFIFVGGPDWRALVPNPADLLI